MSTTPCVWRIGPSGWSYPDWEGIVYPVHKPRGFQPLRFIAGLFNAVEVNSSFYRVPTARMTASWVRQVPAGFRFAVKLTRSLTHERSAEQMAQDVPRLHEALGPLREAGLLGPLLMQFPWSFRYGPEAVDWLRRLSESFADYERFIEVRHRSWEQPEALEVLRRCGGCCNIDQPRLHDCLGPAARVFAGRAYVRLHGRNYANWFAADRPSFARYDYLYEERELREWVERLNEMARQAQTVYVFANNHYRGQGVVNALELKSLLGLTVPAVPVEMLKAYPRLAGVARPDTAPSLFEMS